MKELVSRHTTVYYVNEVLCYNIVLFVWLLFFNVNSSSFIIPSFNLAQSKLRNSGFTHILDDVLLSVWNIWHGMHNEMLIGIKLVNNESFIDSDYHK